MRAPTAFIVTLLPAPERNGVHDLRTLLKFAGRNLHMRALDVREQPTVHHRDARRWIAKQTQRRNEVLTMTINLRKYGTINKWLKLEDFHGKPPRQERIGLVKVENGKFGERIVLVLEPSGQMLSLNKTSVGNLLRDFGEKDDEWVGKLVEIFAGEVDGPQGTTDAILVRGVTDVPADAAIAAKAARAKSADMDDGIPF
jgi:hypothetical protein